MTLEDKIVTFIVCFTWGLLLGLSGIQMHKQEKEKRRIDRAILRGKARRNR